MQIKNESPKNKISDKSNILFWIIIILAVIFLIASARSGFMTFFINLILWGGFIYFFKKKVAIGTYSSGIMIAMLIVIVTISFLTIGKDSEISDKNRSKDMDKYVGKVYELNSTDGKFWGIVGIKGVTEKNSKGKQYLEAQFNIKIKDNLPANGKCPTVPSGCAKGEYHYDYANNLVEPNDNYTDTGDGQLSNTMCNIEAKPEDPMDFGSLTYQCPPEEYNKALKRPAAYFDTAFTQKYLSIEDFLALRKFEVYDGSDFWEIKKEKAMDGSDITTGGIDTDKAVADGKRVREYEFTITEIK